MIKITDKLDKNNNSSENKSKQNHDGWKQWIAMKNQLLKEKKLQEERERKLKEVELEKEKLKKEAAELNRIIWLKKKDDLKKGKYI